MLWILLALSASAGNLVVDARVPAEVWLSTEMVGKVFRPAELHFEAEAGPTELTIFVDGEPHRVEVEVSETGETRVLVGRTGITTSGPAAGPTPAAEGPLSVDFRVTGREDLVLTVGRDRYRVSPGKTLTLEVASGSHPMTLRSDDGTLLFARGTLEVVSEGVVVQLSDGRLPEVIGSGGSFQPGAPVRAGQGPR